MRLSRLPPVYPEVPETAQLVRLSEVLPNSPGQRPKIRLELLIACASFALGLLAYLRPPDPSHPTSFDFLSRAISLPLWLAGIAVLGVAALTAALVRYRVSKSLAPATGETSSDSTSVIAAQKTEINELKSQVASSNARFNELLNAKPNYGTGGGISRVTANLTVHKKPFDFDPECKKLLFSWKEGLSLEIASHTSGTTYGLLLSVVNGSAEWIGAYSAQVADANSWSAAHGQFLPNRGFNRRQINGGKDLGPMRTTNSQCFVRNFPKGDSVQLAIGNDDRTLLSWPNADPTTVEIWRLTLAVSYDPSPDPPGNTKGLPPVYLLVRWDRENATMQMLKCEGKEQFNA